MKKRCCCCIRNPLNQNRIVRSIMTEIRSYQLHRLNKSRVHCWERAGILIINQQRVLMNGSRITGYELIKICWTDIRHIEIMKSISHPPLFPAIQFVNTKSSVIVIESILDRL